MALIASQLANSILDDFGLNEIINAKSVLIDGIKYDARNEEIRDDLIQLQLWLTKIEQDTVKLFHILISASTIESSCIKDGKCCAFDASSITVKGGGMFHIKFTVKLAGIKITADFSLSSQPEKLSYDQRGICGLKGCENPTLLVHAFTMYDGKLTISATGDVVFGKLKIGEGGLLIEIKAPSEIITQKLVCDKGLSEF